MRRTLCSLVVLVIASAALSTVGQAYVWGGYRWASSEVPYYVNPKNADVSEAAALAAIRLGASTWSSQSNANFSFSYAGYTSGSSITMNNKNEVFFRSGTNGGLVAETMRWFDGSGNLLDTDIVFYDGGWRFFTGSSGCADGVYIEDFAAHEFGHALGLKHSSVSTATMYSTGRNCSTSWRTLDPDDLAGVEKIYPPRKSNASPSVAITSPLGGTSAAEGTPLSFSGSASDSEDGNLSPGMVWTSSRDGKIGTGASFARVLTVGTHTITASVSDSDGQTASRQVSVAVNATAPTNEAPSVSISAPADKTSVPFGTTLTFRGSASDAEDGSLTSKLVWNSNLDGPLGMGGSVSRALTVGTHTVRATVSDSDGASSAKQVSVYVIAPPVQPPGLSLSASGYKKKGIQHANLKWTGAASSKVDIYRDGVRVANTANDGAHTDVINHRGGGSYTYKLCEAGTTTCSSSVVVRF